ncbi:MAG: hypothetical protein ABSD71_09400 [Bacteroidales bacterium]|jgi:hypothetical protein
MAISFNNLITSNYSGRVGDIILKNYGGKSVMAKRPDCSKVVKSAKQLEINDRFKKAVKYGQYVTRNPELSMYYKKKRPDLSPYNAGISDYQTRPVIERVDVSGYQGLPRNVVTVSVWKKWNIEGVDLVIFNILGEVIECGAAVPRQFSGNMEWNYSATVENADYQGGRVEVRVTDKPGNVVQEVITLDST